MFTKEELMMIGNVLSRKAFDVKHRCDTLKGLDLQVRALDEEYARNLRNLSEKAYQQVDIITGRQNGQVKTA